MMSLMLQTLDVIDDVTDVMMSSNDFIDVPITSSFPNNIPIVCKTFRTFLLEI